MKVPRDFGNALVVAIVSIGLILGALSISLISFIPQGAPISTSVLIPPTIPLIGTTAPPPSITHTTAPTLPPAAGATVTQVSTTPASCPIPPGWGLIIVQPGETLDSIAARYRIPVDDLRRANCLSSNNLISGSRLSVPPFPTTTSGACIPGASGWVKNYTVKAGDNLFRIGFDHYTTLELMRKVNCRTGDTIYAGEILWVPNIAETRTPEATAIPGDTNTPYPTDPITETALPYTATFIPTPTPSGTTSP